MTDIVPGGMLLHGCFAIDSGAAILARTLDDLDRRDRGGFFAGAVFDFGDSAERSARNKVVVVRLATFFSHGR